MADCETESRICAYSKCEVEFKPTRPHHRFHSERCRYADWEERRENGADNALERASGHPLAEVRAAQAAKKHNRDLGGLIRQAIVNQLRTTGECHADDLVSLYPAGEVALCRRLATAQFGSLASHKLIRKDGWRRSASESRKGAGGWVWKFTKQGWDKYGTAGVEGDGKGGLASTSSGDSLHSGGTPAPPDTAKDSPGIAASAPPAPGGSAAQLFEVEPPSAYDPWEDAA